MTAPAARESGRRALHAASGLLGLAAALLPASPVTVLLVALVVLAAALEAARLLTPTGRAAIHGRFGALFRGAEERRPSGAALLAAAYLAVWLLFPQPVAARAMVVAALADPAAALAGRRFAPAQGRKTWIGSAAAAAAAFAVLALWPTAPLTAAGAAQVAPPDPPPPPSGSPAPASTT